jgi:putative peptide zinc metalloprotease protein
MQPSPTFSESWYRIKDLKARLRPGAQISRQYHRGERRYVVRDPAGNQFYSLSDSAYRFIGLLNGKRSVQQAWDLCGNKLADEAPTQPEVIQILSQLHAASLIEADVTADAAVLLRRHKSMQRRQLQGRLMSLLFPRIPLWDPDHFLKTWLPVMRRVLGGWGALIWLAVAGFAIAAVIPEWSRFQEAALNSIAPGNWPFLWATFVIIKCIHELGHAFACRRFGGECHEMGITFLVFIPMPYVDTSGAWGFASRWQRMFVGAAGMIFELFVAAVCAFIWLGTSPGVPWYGIPVNALAYNAMLIASVTTLLFNANPLLRYDGYYILSDFLEIPNLYQRASEYFLGLIKRYLFCVEQLSPLLPLNERVELLVYAVASQCYRLFVSVMIILMVTTQVPVLGVVMAVTGGVTWLIVPIIRFGKYLALDPELHRKRSRAWAFVLTGVTLLVVTLGLIRFPTRIYATGMLEPSRRDMLTMAQNGFVRDVPVVDGQEVRRGDVILAAVDPELDSEVSAARARVEAARAKAMLSLIKDLAEHRIDLLTQKIEAEKLADAERKRDELIIRAPFSGRVVGPELRNLHGAYLARGVVVAMVARYDKLLVRCNVEQRDAELLMDKETRPDLGQHGAGSATEAALPVRHGIANEIRLAGRIGLVQQGDEVRIINAAQKELIHQSLGHAGGEEIATDPRDRRGLKSMVPEFEVQVTLDNPGLTYLPGQRAYVRFTVEAHPLIWQWSRRFLQVVQAHSRSRWL